MKRSFGPSNDKLPRLIHGADYNPEQWRDHPEVWEEDLRLMELAGCNCMTLGMFSWAQLEPAEGEYDFTWLDEIMDKLAARGIYVIFGTPSGARPHWLAEKYPEVLRVGNNRVRNLFGGRHNHCYTSPLYRAKTAELNTILASRYKDHPALIMWHLSNEYGGECHCELCQDAFRGWLKQKYDNSLDRLNKAWWTTFWSHTYSDWSQIESPAPHGERLTHSLNLDWKRFVTDQTVDFMLAEAAPLRVITPDIPITTNLMGTYPGLNYWKFAPHIDVVSWDNYPQWHCDKSETQLGMEVGFVHDLNRSLKGGKPFLLMESTPSMTNWQAVSKLKKPGMHRLSSLQAVAHGSDSVQYFQWRQSRGSSEKFHGAVVSHSGHEHTRVFRDVAELGGSLARLDEVVGTTTPAEVAIIFDWENRWALEDAQGPRNIGLDYVGAVMSHYKSFWNAGISVDILDMHQDLSRYKLVIAPMLYLVYPGVGEMIEAFVKSGGTFVATYWSGIVDENDLCFLGGFPGPLRRVLGLWSEEVDALLDGEHNSVLATAGWATQESYESSVLCDLIHLEGAEALAVYGQDFYEGRPAVTVHPFGQGEAYYLASRIEDAFHSDFYGYLADRLTLAKNVPFRLPEGVTAQRRTDGEKSFLFVMNFTGATQRLMLPEGLRFEDLLNGTTVEAEAELPAFGVAVWGE